MKIKILILLMLVGVGTLGAGIFKRPPPSALYVRTIAEQAVTERARGKVLQMYGTRRGGELCPTSWNVLFWDTTASHNGRLVTVVKGKVDGIKDGYTELEPQRVDAYKQDEIIDLNLLKVDSSDALRAAMKTPALKGVKVSSVQFLLAKGDGAVQPVWNLKLFTGKAGEEIEIEEVKLSARTGEIFAITRPLVTMKSRRDGDS